eukprot:1138148-Pelagomonas_calceolata.AAC.1
MVWGGGGGGGGGGRRRQRRRNEFGITMRNYYSIRATRGESRSLRKLCGKSLKACGVRCLIDDRLGEGIMGHRTDSRYPSGNTGGHRGNRKHSAPATATPPASK